MFETKAFEIVDRHTLIPAIATKVGPTTNPPTTKEDWLSYKCGYSMDTPYILLTRLAGGYPCNYDPYAWGDRTMHFAHQYIIGHWDQLGSGDVVDVECVLNEKTQPKASEWQNAVP